MASIKLPETVEGVFTLTEQAISGLRIHGVAAGIDALEPLLVADLAAARQAIEAEMKAKTDVAAKSKARVRAERNLSDYLRAGISYLKPTLGYRWNQHWQSLGVPVGSVALPRKADRVLLITENLHAYLLANPEKQIAAFEFTAARALELCTAVKEARNEFNDADVTYQNCRDASKATLRVLRTRLRTLRSALALFGPSDPRWLAFGFARPADPSIAEVPAEVVVTQTPEPEAIQVTWKPSRRAERYRIYAQAKEEPAPAEVALARDTAATLRGLAPDREYGITVTAVNEAGESRPSVPVFITIVVLLPQPTAPSLSRGDRSRYTTGAADPPLV